MMLRTEDLNVAYDPGEDIIKGVDIHVEAAENVCIIGPNGAGKSTLLKGIGGFATVTAGSVMFDGTEITNQEPWEIMRQGIGFVPQERSIFPELTVAENLDMGGWVLSRSEYETNVERVLEELPVLAEKADAKAKSLSGGQMRLLEIGRGLVLEPRLLLVDEPSAGLSPQNQQRVFDKLVTLGDQLGTAVLYIEQNIEKGVAISDRFYILKRGEIVDTGTREAFSKERFSAAYFSRESRTTDPQ